MPRFTLAEEVDAEIGGIIDDEKKPGEPFDYFGYAAALSRELDERGASHMDPPDLDYWREVAAELRRRGG